MTTEESYTYGDLGVDVGIEALAADILYRYSQQTWPNRDGKLGEVEDLQGGFSKIRFNRIEGLPEGIVEECNTDGAGHKPDIAVIADRFDTIATDLIAMVVDDAAIKGAEPAKLTTILKVNTLGQDESRLPIIEKLASGYIEPCREASVAITNGEIAQHPSLGGDTSKFSFDWGANVTWYAHESRLLDGSAIAPGDYIIGLQEEGIRCNGVSAVIKALELKYGRNKWGEEVIDGTRLADQALRPSRIYSPAIVDMTGGYDLNRKEKAKLHGAVHVTGSGIPGKLGRLLLPLGLGAMIDDPFEPSSLIRGCQYNLRMTDYEAYRTWHMGQGMLLIASAVEDVLAVAHSHGIVAKVIGQITDSPHISINSKGYYGSTLIF